MQASRLPALLAPLPVCIWACIWIACATPPAAAQIHVDAGAQGANDGTSWSDAYTALRDALGVAASGDEVWVAAGTYTPNASVHGTPGDEHSSFEIPDGVRVLGGFAGIESSADERARLFADTTLSGDLAGDDPPGFPSSATWSDNSFNIVLIEVGGPETRLDGFRITRGVARASSGVGTRGGGARVHLGEPVLANLVFTGNYAQNQGGGLYVLSSRATVIGCRFTGNLAHHGAGASVAGGTPLPGARFRGCSFSGNWASFGAGMAMQSHNLTLFDCTFTDNEAIGGGALRATGGTLDLVEVRFFGNRSVWPPGGGGCGALQVGFGVARLQNCVFTGNRGVGGGAIATGTLGSLDLSGCTLVGNASMWGSGGIVSQGAAVSVRNSILWDNWVTGANSEADQIRGVDPLVEYSCIRGLTGALGGVGNISSDPLFVDARGPDGVLGTVDDDLRLAAGSPCIDAADTAGILADALDLDGDGDVSEPTPYDAALAPRTFDDPASAGSGPAPDMGAFEHTGPAVGSVFCSPAVPNSTGRPAHLDALGSAAVSAGSFLLRCTRAPPGQVGYFLVGRVRDFVPAPGGSAGNLCLAGPIGRFNQALGTIGIAGVFHTDVDLASLPFHPVPAAVAPGDVWLFQAWFRDGATSNFSGATEVLFR